MSNWGSNLADEFAFDVEDEGFHRLEGGDLWMGRRHKIRNKTDKDELFRINKKEEELQKAM